MRIQEKSLNFWISYFETTLVKMKVDVKKVEKVWKDTLKLLDGDCPEKSCEWCEGR